MIHQGGMELLRFGLGPHPIILTFSIAPFSMMMFLTILLKVTEMKFPFQNESDTQYFVIGKPSYISIDDHFAGTDRYIETEILEGSINHTVQMRNVMVGDRYYFWIMHPTTKNFHDNIEIHQINKIS
jgi:hypothetical protein